VLSAVAREELIILRSAATYKHSAIDESSGSTLKTFFNFYFIFIRNDGATALIAQV
jgi:hypothetical protein